MRQSLANILQKQKEAQHIQKVFRRQKAVQKFSKDRFIKNHDQLGAQKQTLKVNVTNTVHSNFIQNNVKTDLLLTLSNLGVNFQNSDKNISLFNLSFYDSKGSDEILFIPLQNTMNARCLVKTQQPEKIHKYVHGKILKFDFKKNKYIFQYEQGKGKIKSILAPRLYLCLDIQNPITYCKRFANAYFSRIYADNLLRLKFYVDSMPTQNILQLDATRKKKIRKHISKFQTYDYAKEEALFKQVQDDYFKSVNSIIAKKHIKESFHQLIPTNIIINIDHQSKCTPAFGLITIKANKQIFFENGQVHFGENFNFTKKIQQFASKTLFSDQRINQSLRQIQIQCQKITQYPLFKLSKQLASVRFQQYQAQHNSYIQRSISRLRKIWINNIIEIIQKNFGSFVPQQKIKIVHHQPNSSSSSTNLDKFDINEYSKFESYFRLVKYIMQASLREMCQKSFNSFYEDICSRIPQKVQINSSYEVINYFKSKAKAKQEPKQNRNMQNFNTQTEAVEFRQNIDTSIFQKIYKAPLFQTDLMRSLDDTSFNYATVISNFTNLIINVFNRMTEEVNKLPQIQQNILSAESQKQKPQRYLSAPNRRQSYNQQYLQNQNISHNSFISINFWLIDLHNRLKEKLDQSVKSLAQYILKFQELIPVLKLKPEQIIMQMDEEDDLVPKNIIVLKEEVCRYNQLEKQLLQKMPEHIHISFFKVNLNDTVHQLALKYRQIAQGIQNLIAKKVKKTAKSFLARFAQMKDEINQKPKQVEKLFDIKRRLPAIQAQLQDIEIQIQASDEIYQILENFQYYLPSQDVRNRYQAKMAPKFISGLIQKKYQQLQILTEQFSQQLSSQQENFNYSIQILSRTVSQFHVYNKKQEYEQTFQKVCKIEQALKNCFQDSKNINSKEYLFGKQITDYSKIRQLFKQFEPYSIMWKAIFEWKQNKEAWTHTNQCSSDSQHFLAKIQMVLKNISQSILYFKDRQIMHIAKIAENIKEQINEFQSKISLQL